MDGEDVRVDDWMRGVDDSHMSSAHKTSANSVL